MCSYRYVPHITKNNNKTITVDIEYFPRENVGNLGKIGKGLLASVNLKTPSAKTIPRIPGNP